MSQLDKEIKFLRLTPNKPLAEKLLIRLELSLVNLMLNVSAMVKSKLTSMSQFVVKMFTGTINSAPVNDNLMEY